MPRQPVDDALRGWERLPGSDGEQHALADGFLYCFIGSRADLVRRVE